MSRSFSPISRAMSIIFHGIVLIALYYLAYGWSLEQTEVFMLAIIPGGEARYGAYLVQFAPQVLLVIAAIYMARRNARMAYLYAAAALAVNAIDAYTNITTFEELWPGLSAQVYALGRSPDFVEATYPIGMFMAFAVTWFEELGALVAGSMLQVISEFASGMGWSTPRFFRADATAYARAAGGDIGALRQQQRQNDRPPTRPRPTRATRPLRR